MNIYVLKPLLAWANLYVWIQAHYTSAKNQHLYTLHVLYNIYISIP